MSVSTDLCLPPCQFFLEFPKGPLMFIIYINDLPACLSMSKSLLTIDVTKIYNIATNPQDCAALQDNLDLAMSWSEIWDMHFNPIKSIHLSINAKVSTEYRIARTDVMTRISVHKDLGIVMSDNLLWNQHYE